MANTRNQQETLSINLCDRDITAYLISKSETDKDSIYAFMFAGKIHALTKKDIDKKIEVNRNVAFSESTMLMLLSVDNIKIPGLITPELEKKLLSEAEESNNNLTAFRLDNMVYFPTTDNVETISQNLAMLYVQSNNTIKAKEYLSRNSAYPPLSMDSMPLPELINKLMNDDITQPTSTTDQQQYVEQNNAENKQETKATKKPTIQGLMFFAKPHGQSESSNPALYKLEFKRQ